MSLVKRENNLIVGCTLGGQRSGNKGRAMAVKSIPKLRTDCGLGGHADRLPQRDWKIGKLELSQVLTGFQKGYNI